MSCLFCEWEMGYSGGVDPCDVLVAFDDHLAEHLSELILEIPKVT